MVSSHQHVTKKDLDQGLSTSLFWSMIELLNQGVTRHYEIKEFAVSAIEFGLTPQSPFLSTLLPVQFEQPLTGLGTGAADDERLSHLFQSVASTTARLKLLADLSYGVSGNAELDSVLPQLTANIRQLMMSDVAILGRALSEEGRVQITAFDAEHDVVPDQESAEAVGELFWEHLLSTGKAWTGHSKQLSHYDGESTVAFSLNSCILPLIARDRILGMLALGKRDDCAYTQDELDYLAHVSNQITVLIENDLLRAELQKLKAELGEETMYVDYQLPSEASFEEIVGRSSALQRVLRKIEVVAPTDSGVLIQGETGTGKELIARAIHNLSGRRDKPFIKVNCAAIPSGLLESELFGHEKGAFTGAVMRKPGRFEVADKGTLFLDEVGDIPLELQSKLLRVLQEREFERLGSTRTQQVDVRVVAATHRDLKQMVEEGTFRSDLYYRLHVFPLVVPPLRDRREDIPLVVRHYVDKYSKRMNRRIETIPAKSMEVFTNYSWPGNVRELQNFIERAVILSPGSSLRAPLEELKEDTAPASSTSLSTLEEMEREHVLRALRESNWVTGGPGGAAARLGMKRTTLAYRIRKLKIACRPD
jgi:formate hydrogenlyase transcriptional activator